MLMTLQLTDAMRNIQLGSHCQQQPQPPQFNASQMDPMAASSFSGQFSGLENSMQARNALLHQLAQHPQSNPAARRPQNVIGIQLANMPKPPI